ncbi:MAG: L-threonylcarbamoyladenylate synthase [Candidatus Adiutrix sp.]|nr:L-threonylcarbamoyladenylate synthase [Candidatus Adiutrix sp.]
MSKRLIIDPRNVAFEALAPAARMLLDGGVVAGPTASFYALMALADGHPALEKVVELKGAEGRQGKASLILLDQPARALCYARETPEAAWALMSRFWPGPLTLLFPAQTGLHASLVGPARTVALRLESLLAVRRLVRMVDRGLTGTSANPAGEAPADRAEAVLDYFGDSIDLIIDGGVTGGGPPSAIIDVSLAAPRLIRGGPLSAGDLRAACPSLEF